MPLDAVVVVQARMESTRLPGKVMKPILGRPMIHLLLERLRDLPVRDLIFAISEAEESKPLRDFLKSQNVSLVTGHPTNVYERFLKALKSRKEKVLVRVTADNPLTDCDVIPRGIQKLLDENLDWVWMSNCPVGLGCDIFNLDTFRSFSKTPITETEQEHLVPLFRRPGIRNAGVRCDFPDGADTLRLTVDTPEDFSRMEKIFSRFYHDGKIHLQEAVKTLLESGPSFHKL